MAAFRDLATCRSMDGPIPWDRVQLYAEVKGLDQDMANLLWSVIQQLDLAERKWHHDNPPPKEDSPKG